MLDLHGRSKISFKVNDLGALFVRISDELERDFRIRVAEKYVGERGALSKALEEAIKLWIKS